jgi:hypothetical protein
MKRRDLSIFSVRLFLLLPLFMWGCLAKEKRREVKTYTPPWDNGREVLQELEGYAPSDSDTVFTVFREMARIDSLAGPRQQWQYEPNSPDTLRVHHLIDTAFDFPEKAEGRQAFAYDETYRDDTLFRLAYGNGLFIEEHPCTDVWIATPPFMHPTRWLRAGMSEKDVIKAMGTPSLRHENALRYLYRDDAHVGGPTSSDSSLAPLADFQHIEGIHFYFKNGGLFAAVFQRGRACH